MIYKLPKEEKDLSQEIIVKVKKLVAPKDSEWKNKFGECSINKELYESLIKKIINGSIRSDEINETISNKRKLGAQISDLDNELLKMLNEPVDKTDVEISLGKVQQISGHGHVIFRGLGLKGVYSKPIGRK